MFDENKCPAYLLPRNEPKQYGEGALKALTERGKLKQMIAEMCNELHHPVAVLDFSTLPEAKDVENADLTKVEKLESDVNIFSLRDACKLLRKYAGSSYCKKCDVFHAACMDVCTEKIERKIQNAAEHKLSFFSAEYENYKPKTYTVSGRPVIEYHCPMLGYRELLFPIRYLGRVFGVLFVGQITVTAEDKQIISDIRTSFFDGNPPEALFGENVKKYNAAHSEDPESPENVKKFIMRADQHAELYNKVLNFQIPRDGTQAGEDRLEYYFKNFSNEYAFNEFLRKVCLEIDYLENKLLNQHIQRQRNFFEGTAKDITEQAMKEYAEARKTKYADLHMQRAAELRAAWKSLYSIAHELRIRFSFIEDITVFGDGQSPSIESSDISIENADFKKAQYSLGGSIRDQSYDFSHARSFEITDFVDSVNSAVILQWLSETIPRDNRILIVCSSIAMLLRVKELESHKYFYKQLAESIGIELARVNSIVALSKSELTQEQHLLTLRMYRHETAHISGRLQDNLDRYFSDNRMRFLNLREQKQRQVINDMNNTVQLISRISDNIGLVTGSIGEGHEILKRKDNFDCVDMLYKWQSMFQAELEDRNLEITVLRSYDAGDVSNLFSGWLNDMILQITGSKEATYGPGARYITINSRLFELLVYNFVDNAVKYAYRGTSIYLIWRRVKQAYELSVSSYGPEIEEGDAMYQLYARGNGTINHLQGDGIGLYAVKRIAQLLGLEVGHDCERISNYNIPLISWYKNADFGTQSDYQRIEDSVFDGDYDKSQDRFVVNRYNNTSIKESDLTKKYLKKRIDYPTWRTTFYVKIPL